MQLRAAQVEDVPVVRELVQRAFALYVERIKMTENLAFCPRRGFRRVHSAKRLA
jgi:hypothetical protein